MYNILVENSPQITDFLEQEKEKMFVPGIVAGIYSFKLNKLLLGASGKRRLCSSDDFGEVRGNLINIMDKVHIGSCTKAMTSVLLAILVSENILSWDSKLRDQGLKIHGDFDSVTLLQLLNHRGAIPVNAVDWHGHISETDVVVRRRKILEDNLSVGSSNVGDFLYSNLGYVAAGYMAENATRKSWESLMQEKLFTPLLMNSAGFGSPSIEGSLFQPLGHIDSGSGWKARSCDNPEVFGPAGRVHCNLVDWSKFLSLYFSNETYILGKADLGLRKLVEPVGGYAAGWLRPEKSNFLFHSGSNTLWFSNVLVDINSQKAYMVAMNAAFSDNEKSQNYFNGIIKGLIEIGQR